MAETVKVTAICSTDRRQPNQFASVSLQCGENACAAAAAVAGKRILLDEAPDLPLGNCPAGSCDCHYFRYGDRRNLLMNRRSGNALNGDASDRPGKQNRRRGNDRRRIRSKILRPV